MYIVYHSQGNLSNKSLIRKYVPNSHQKYVKYGPIHVHLADSLHDLGVAHGLVDAGEGREQLLHHRLAGPNGLRLALEVLLGELVKARIRVDLLPDVSERSDGGVPEPDSRQGGTYQK